MELAQAVERYAYSALTVPPSLTLEVEQVKAMVKELENYHALYSAFFQTEPQRTAAYHYLAGLLDPTIQRKSIENIALATVGPQPR